MGSRKQSIRIFTEDEIEIITSNYSTPIGNGGFGVVYRGILDGDNDLVAVKRYIRRDLRKEFMEEVRIHSQLNHNNVVKLIGYCASESTLMLVTEYVSNGNLDQILHCSGIPIPLDKRLGIAIGCAEALSYMHSMHSSDSLVYHGDIKPANILLDGNYSTKVSDFGLSRLLFGGVTQFTTSLKGTAGYMDPVYFHEGCLTPRSDVYSFGVVLSELLSRKKVKGDSNIIQTFSKSSVSGKDLKELFDPEIANDNNMKTLKEMRKLASECLTLQIRSRPQMSDVAKRLRKLKKDLKGSSESILATHTVWHKQDKHGTSMSSSFKKSFSFFKGNASSSSRILLELGNSVRIFTLEEIDEVTQNYSHLIGGGTSAQVYRGTLEDNTQVVVRKFYKDYKEVFINRGVILSRIVHKNIIKLLGCCLEADSLVFVYEYVAKGSLFDILGSQEDFPLDLRMRVAIKIAEALEFLHSPATGIIGHGRVAASNILLDDNFVPKLADFSVACKLIKESEATSDNMIGASLLEQVLCTDPSRYESVLMNLERDVYRFGGVLFALISRTEDIDHNELIFKFTKAYEKDGSGKAIFDKSITDEEDIHVLEEIGTLALKCTVLNVDEMPKRPTMKEVAEHLRLLRRSWKKRITKAGTQVIEAAPAPSPQQPRIPNVMRNLYGYRRISVDDPVHV